jgi:hypothetical protein
MKWHDRKVANFCPSTTHTHTGQTGGYVQHGFDSVLLEAFGRAFHWQHLLDTGVATSSAKIARLEKLNPSR